MSDLLKQDSAAAPNGQTPAAPDILRLERPGAAPATIRRAAAPDAEVLARLGARTFSETFGHTYAPQDLAAFLAEHHTPAKAAQSLADPRSAVWLVERGGEAIGFALVGPCGLPHSEVAPDDLELKRIYLLAAHQGGGLGGRLLRLALDWAASHGSGRIWLGVWSQNLRAQRLYAREGFAKVGEYDFIVGAQRDHEFILRRG